MSEWYRLKKLLRIRSGRGSPTTQTAAQGRWCLPGCPCGSTCEAVLVVDVHGVRAARFAAAPAKTQARFHCLRLHQRNQQHALAAVELKRKSKGKRPHARPDVEISTLTNLRSLRCFMSGSCTSFLLITPMLTLEVRQSCMTPLDFFGVRKLFVAVATSATPWRYATGASRAEGSPHNLPSRQSVFSPLHGSRRRG